MDWIHETKREWIKARKTCLTATEIADVCCSRNEKSMIKKLEGYWISKQSLEPVVTRSTGAAARGHILEPYAVEQYNHEKEEDMPAMYHWDDILVRNSELHIGYSPDATTIKPTDDFPTVIEADGTGDAYAIMEIKSYSAARHWECYKKEPKKEMYQVAAAMVVDSCIKEAILYFYNPDLPEAYSKGYICDKESLKEELEKVKEVVGLWNRFSHHGIIDPRMVKKQKPLYTTDDIVKAESSSLNVAKRAGII